MINEGEVVALGLTSYIAKSNGRYWLGSDLGTGILVHVISKTLAVQLLAGLGLTYIENLKLKEGLM